MRTEWLDALAGVRQRGEAAVLVTLLAVRGSTPREAGVKMVVTHDATYGTIGGGNLEFRSVQHARTVLACPPHAPLVKEFPLGPTLGQCCGGHASVVFEPVLPPAWRIALYGAGHVGRALAGLLGGLDCRVTWIDARPEFLPPDLPANVIARAELPPESLPPGTFVLIMTHDHALDFRLTEAALARADLPFVGLIGSETKRARFLSRLRRAGVAEADIARLTCPIGLPGTGGKAPAEIAIAVAAQLLQQRHPAKAAEPPPPDPAHVCGECGAAGCATREETLA